MASGLNTDFQAPKQDSLALEKRESELVLLVFIHGFKGTDETFGEFPQRIQHLLSETLDHAVVQSMVFPAYEVMSFQFIDLAPAFLTVNTS